MLNKLRPKLRGKLALGTAIFTGIFIFFLLFFFHQISQDNLKEANMQQAESIFNSVRSAFESHLTVSKTIKSLVHKQKRIRKDDKLPAKYKKKKLNQYDKKLEKLKERLQDETKNIRGLFKTRPEDYQVTFISRNWVLLSHSHPEHLVRSKLGRKMPRSTIKAARYATHRKIFNSFKRKKNKDFAPISSEQVIVNYNRGFLSFIQPVFANRDLSAIVELVNEMFSTHVIDKENHLRAFFSTSQEANQFRNDFMQVSNEFELTIDILDKYEKTYIYEQHKQNKETEFSSRDFYKDPAAKKAFKKLVTLNKQRKKQWRFLRKKIRGHFKKRRRVLEKRFNFLKENNAEPEDQVVVRLEIKRLEKRQKQITSALRAFATAYSDTIAATEDKWQRKRASYIGNLRSPIETGKTLLNDFFGGIAEIRILLDEKIKKSSSLTFSMVDVGFSFFLRALFLVFLLSSFFVRDIKSLAKTAGRVEKGDLDAQFKVDSKDELSDLARAFNEMISGLKEKEALRLEIETASVIQRNLLPQELEGSLQSYDVSFMYRAMTGVGGDYIDFFAVNEETSCLVVADVSNHGVGPGLVMTMMRSSLRTMAKQNVDLSQLVSRLNSSLYEDTPSEIFVSVFIAYIKTKTRSIEYVSCGHNPPYVLSAAGVKELGAGGMALGAMMPAIFDSSIKSQKLTLAKDEYLYQYTDGLTEAFNPQKELLGEERVEALLKKIGESKKISAKKVIDNSIALLEKFTQLKLPADGPTELTDDVAIICVGIK